MTRQCHLQAQMQQMAAAGGPGAHAGALAPGMNPLLGMGMGPGGLLSGMHPLANLQNQLQGFALFQVHCLMKCPTDLCALMLGRVHQSFVEMLRFWPAWACIHCDVSGTLFGTSHVLISTIARRPCRAVACLEETGRCPWEDRCRPAASHQIPSRLSCTSSTRCSS